MEVSLRMCVCIVLQGRRILSDAAARRGLGKPQRTRIITIFDLCKVTTGIGNSLSFAHHIFSKYSKTITLHIITAREYTFFLEAERQFFSSTNMF